jgi:hypothetical protein
MDFPVFRLDFDPRDFPDLEFSISPKRYIFANARKALHPHTIGEMAGAVLIVELNLSHQNLS